MIRAKRVPHRWASPMLTEFSDVADLGRRRVFRAVSALMRPSTSLDAWQASWPLPSIRRAPQPMAGGSQGNVVSDGRRGGHPDRLTRDCARSVLPPHSEAFAARRYHGLTLQCLVEAGMSQAPAVDAVVFAAGPALFPGAVQAFDRARRTDVRPMRRVAFHSVRIDVVRCGACIASVIRMTARRPSAASCSGPRARDIAR